MTYLWTRKIKIEFRKSYASGILDSDLGISKRILQHCRMGHFSPQFGYHISGINRHENFTRDVSLCVSIELILEDIRVFLY